MDMLSSSRLMQRSQRSPSCPFRRFHSTSGASRATVSTTQRDLSRRGGQQEQHVEYEQQVWQAVQESDKCFRFHHKQDAKDNTTSSLMEMMQSSFTLWTMALWMRTPKQAT